MAFSPDGTLLCSTSWDNTVRLWNLETGRVLSVLRGHTDIVSSAAFSPDGRVLASGSWDGDLRLWEVAGGKELALLQGHDRQISSVAFSPNGRVVASGSWDGAVRLWNAGGGGLDELLSKIKAYTAWGLSYHLDSNGQPEPKDLVPLILAQGEAARQGRLVWLPRDGTDSVAFYKNLGESEWLWKQAVRNGHPRDIKLLIDQGADINRKDEKDRTALMLAAQDCKPAVVQWLIDKGAGIDPVDKEGAQRPVLRGGRRQCWHSRASPGSGHPG